MVPGSSVRPILLARSPPSAPIPIPYPPRPRPLGGMPPSWYPPPYPPPRPRPRPRPDMCKIHTGVAASSTLLSDIMLKVKKWMHQGNVARYWTGRIPESASSSEAELATRRPRSVAEVESGHQSLRLSDLRLKRCVHMSRRVGLGTPAPPLNRIPGHCFLRFSSRPHCCSPSALRGMQLTHCPITRIVVFCGNRKSASYRQASGREQGAAPPTACSLRVHW